MSAKPLRTRSKSASADRCLRPLGATIDMATPDPKTSNGFSVQGIFAWGFTKRQPGWCGDYRVLSLSGNYCCLSNAYHVSIAYNALERVCCVTFFQCLNRRALQPIPQERRALATRPELEFPSTVTLKE